MCVVFELLDLVCVNITCSRKMHIFTFCLEIKHIFLVNAIDLIILYMCTCICNANLNCKKYSSR